MATAGSIVVDLLMRTGSFETDTDRATKKAQKQFKDMERQAKETADAISRSIGGVLSGALFGVGLGSIFSKFITETRNSQDEQAQLAAVLRSTGEAAGWTQTQLNQMAGSLAGVFSEGDINRAQTRLLSYTGVVGEEFPRALQAAIDMAARMGVEVEQAAETVGRALDVPSQGLSSLSKQGFRFTDDQKKLVEQLEKAGKVAEAQAIVLSALESSYGGAADAARDTLGGALKALQNQIDDLMTGDDGSVNGLTASINDLTAVLGSPETQQAFATFVGWLADVSRSLVTLIGDFASGMSAAGSFTDALATYGLMNPFNSHAENAAKYRKELEELDAFEKRVLAGQEQNQGVDIAAKRLQLQNRIAFSDRKANAQERDVFAAYQGVGETGRDIQMLPALTVAGRPPGGSGAKKKVDQGQKLIDQLNQRIALIGKETEYERLLAEISVGSIKFRTEAQQKEALEAAKAFDTKSKVFEASKRQAEDYAKVMDDLYPEREKTNGYLAQLSTLSQAYFDGTLNAETYSDAVKQLEKNFSDSTDEMGEFAKEAARGIQNSLGDGLYQIMQGNFKNIGSAFLQMLQKMAADALAAQIAKKLFGDFDKSGNIGGLFGALFQGFGGGSGPTAGQLAGATQGVNAGLPLAFDEGGFTGPGGKFDVAGVVHRGEYVINAASTKRLGRGFLDRLNGYAEGGFVGARSAPALSGMVAGGMTLNIETRGVDIEVVESRRNEMFLIARQVVASDAPSVMQREIANPSSRSSRQLARSTTAERRR
ncbi:phage tail length tape measure family protein [Achromobacter sp. UBA4530]|uniref:phage tail length tape measure family protein n=1 Tax=Achromobacter sp. UBA4530 TaxID=1945912 RepID=UPI00257A4769|nr:phage tail length tape measure family protein [Achromobacter sp. UBA4530]